MPGISAKFVGWKIRAIRKKRGIKSVMALARMIDPENARSLGVSIGGYEEGTNIPNVVILHLISRALKCGMHEFIEDIE